MQMHTVPPDPPGSLVARRPTETTIDLSWTLGSDGNSVITGVDIEYSSQSAGELHNGHVNLTGEDVVMHTLTNLRPFTDYTIQVFVVNAIGRSNPGATSGMTLSLRK